MSPDPFGIGEAIQHGLRMLLHGQRHSGRTEAMLDLVREHDTILVALTPVKHDLLRRIRDRGFRNVDVVVVDPRTPHDIVDCVRDTRHRVLLDHSIYEAFYSYGMDHARMEMERVRKCFDQRYEAGKYRDIRTEVDKRAVEAMGGDMQIVGGPKNE